MATMADGTPPNLLIVRIQPEEGISLKFLSKRPGAGMKLRPVSMDFNYGSSFGERSPSAYETLLLDAMIGDATLYTRQDMVEASWTVVEPIQNVWREDRCRLSQLRRGNAGARRPPTTCWRGAATCGGSHDGHRRSREDSQGTGRPVGRHAASRAQAEGGTGRAARLHHDAGGARGGRAKTRRIWAKRSPR